MHCEDKQEEAQFFQVYGFCFSPLNTGRPMKRITLLLLLGLMYGLPMKSQPSLFKLIRQVPEYWEEESSEDWLIKDIRSPAGVYNKDNEELILANGLVKRSFRLWPNGATTELKNLRTGETMLRGIKPEATVTINNVEYPVGGLEGQKEYGYLLPEWLHDMTSHPNAFRLLNFTRDAPEAHLNWKQKRYASASIWPPRGQSLSFYYQHPDSSLQGIEVVIHYTLYQGMPLFEKWIEVD